jgi:glycosyltransferase involved in cell wall biosynthesis
VIALVVVMPHVSVLVPTHNRPGMLADALASVRTQTFPDYEIIIISNGETSENHGRSHAVAATAVASRFMLGQRGNVPAARNSAVSRAAGELARQVEEAAGTGVDMVGRSMSVSRVSIIVTTHNRPDALAAVLSGLADQTHRNFEIVIADDGSEPDASTLAGAFGARHVWHPHRGFRAAAIRNRGVEASSGNYLIFLDGDCVPRPSFVERHHALAEPGWFVAGNRALLSEKATSDVLSFGGRLPGNWLLLRLRGDLDRIGPLLTLPIPRKMKPGKWTGAQACNLAMWRSDFDRAGGFDEAYEGWGYEDSDLVVRLIRNGIRRMDGRFSTGVVHLWHPPRDRTSSLLNFNRLQVTLGRNASCRVYNGRRSSGP